MKLLETFIFNTIFPALCFGCKREGSYLCKNCSLFVSESLLRCSACNKESEDGETHESCKVPNGLDGLVSLWEYEGVMKIMIQEIKKFGVFHAIKELSLRAFLVMGNQQERFFSFLSVLFSTDTVISFVPMDVSKEKRRGFNQAEHIAQEFSAISQKECFPLLEKVQEPKNFSDLVSSQKNFVYSFSHVPKQVVLVDDAWISGSTMKECCAALKEGGVDKIWGLTLAKIP